jgi:hypothetical protein
LGRSALVEPYRVAPQFVNEKEVMTNDIDGLRALADAYGSAAHDMDADRFGQIMHPDGSATRIGPDGAVSIVRLKDWIENVRTRESPRELGVPFSYSIHSIGLEKDLGLINLALVLGQDAFTDLLSCLKIDGNWKIMQKVFRHEKLAG